METEFNSFTLIVNEASIKNNNLPAGEFKLNPQIEKRIGKVNSSENAYAVEVRVEIYNTSENPFPVDLVASVSGIFNIFGDNTEEINNFLQIQGFQMVFPYLRSLVSNMTANAMMPPIFLPIVFANQFEEKPITEQFEKTF